METDLDKLEEQAFFLYLEQQYKDALSMYLHLLVTYAKQKNVEKVEMLFNLISSIGEEWAKEKA